MQHQRSGDSLTTSVRIDGNVSDVRLVDGKPQPGITNDVAVLACHHVVAGTGPHLVDLADEHVV